MAIHIPMIMVCRQNFVMWAVISTPLLNILCTKGFGCCFISPLSYESSNFVGYAFVDVSDVIDSSLVAESPQSVTSTLQNAVDTWEVVLRPPDAVPSF
jgi:hypothetical protein